MWEGLEPPPSRAGWAAAPLPARGAVGARRPPRRSQPPRGGLTSSRPRGGSGSLPRRPGPAGAVRRPSSTSPSPLGPHTVAGRPSPVQLILRGPFRAPLHAPYASLGPKWEAPPGRRAPRGPPAPQPDRAPLPPSRAAGGGALRPRAGSRPSAAPQGVTPPRGAHHRRSPPPRGARRLRREAAVEGGKKRKEGFGRDRAPTGLSPLRRSVAGGRRAASTLAALRCLVRAEPPSSPSSVLAPSRAEPSAGAHRHPARRVHR